MRKFKEKAAELNVTILSVDRSHGRPVAKIRDNDTKAEWVLNESRLGEYLTTKENQLLRAKYLESGGTVTVGEDGVAIGLQRSKYVGRRGGGGKKAEPIKTGDQKFDMYLNALPQPVRVLVVPLGWDPRELYKEYRALKKDGLIAKYATEANVEAAKGGA